MHHASYAVFALLTAAILSGQDLRKVYDGKLEWVDGALGRSWTADFDDVWKLKSFRYRVGKTLELELGACEVVFGKHVDDKGGKNVVWAVVLPTVTKKRPLPRISSTHAGDGEGIKSIWMRFHPSLVGTLFPRKTVRGRGDPMNLIRAKRIYSAKISGGWQAENMPVIPRVESIVFDVQADAGHRGFRRYYVVNTKKKTCEYVNAFAKRELNDPPSTAITSKDSLRAYDDVWKAFDRNYAMFVIKPHVDWKKLRARYRPLAKKARTVHEAAGVISLLLDHLGDLHVWTRAENDTFSGFNRMRMLNANWRATKNLLGGKMNNGKGVSWTRHDDIGYINVWNLSKKEVVDAFHAALDKLRDTKGLIVDIRFNGGGGENLATAMAGRFADKERVYSKNRYRAGAKHDQLTRMLERKFAPTGPWQYKKPVVALFGRKTMSSAESMALMLAQCPNVTTMGDHTAGSSANPRRVEVCDGKIVVNMPRWLDMDPSGKPFEDVGIAPDKVVKAASAAFRRGDPVVAAALKSLRR